MILKTKVENRWGNRIEAGEQVSILSSKGDEVYIMPLKARGNSLPKGAWINKEEVE